MGKEVITMADTRNYAIYKQENNGDLIFLTGVEDARDPEHAVRKAQRYSSIDIPTNQDLMVIASSTGTQAVVYDDKRGIVT